jgi:uncharacterized membrane protein YozB (DUF420 family)
MTLDQIIPYLPHFQALLNTAASLFLALGYYFIRKVSYLTYHAAVGYMPFAGQGIIRPFYFTLLASHVILAAVIVPLVLVTVFFAIRGNFIRHPRLARWTLPLWLYVSLSGVVIYLLGFHVYPPEM